ncbi:MAG: ferredoxin:glutaredoxin reductase [Methanoregulaceae archaeon]|jgi:ferredoxin-thioredoxin reductase catalytic subunit/rubredoxin|nr:ferredoxin:glutaredoxin reductase [Methanoregulaceae archaeon]
MTEIPDEEVVRLVQKLDAEAESGGYHLHPDIMFVKGLARGLLANQLRYGYPSCPCRLASGIRDRDLDIICPCDYRDPDLDAYGGCYCALYVSREVREGKKTLGSIPERRPPRSERQKAMNGGKGGHFTAAAFPVWRCRVCGYLCARDEPPLQCPICKVSKDRFERFA